MARNFKQLFLAALKKSTPQDNVLADMVHDVLRSGYDACEIAAVLQKLHQGLLDEEHQEIVQEALEDAQGKCARLA